MPPSSGWKIANLPERAAHLQSSWVRVNDHLDSSKSAWGQMLNFLRSNGISTNIEEVRDLSIPQWCDPDPFRCKGYRKKGKVFLPWAKAEWEKANLDLQDPMDPGVAIDAIMEHLTARIRSRVDGCRVCAGHWMTHTTANPVPDNPTLQEAREYLVLMHNLTREGQEPTPFEEVATKFNWT